MKFLHENRLKLLHKQIRSVFTPEYYNRYIDVRLDNHVDRFEWRRKDFARLMSLLEFERAYTGVGFNKLLTFNGENDPEVKLINCDLWFDAAYKEGHDLHCLELNYNNYDFVPHGRGWSLIHELPSKQHSSRSTIELLYWFYLNGSSSPSPSGRL